MKKVAIITGASSGLGKAYALALQKEKDIDSFWLIARRQEKLEELRDILQKPAKVLPLDLTKKDSFEVLQQELSRESVVITWLINAAGIGKIGKSEKISLSDNQTMISLNCLALVQVTTLCLPFMQAHSKIMEIASIAAFQPMPNFNVYAASKAFVQSYAKALHKELYKRKIHVTCVCPYWIKDTEFIAVASKEKADYYQHKPLAGKTQTVVAISLIDAKRNAFVSTPSFMSFLDRIIAKIVPHWLYSWLMLQISKL